MHTYEQIVHQAFLQELHKIASAAPAMDPMVKEAFIGSLARGVSKLRGGGANPFKGGPGVFQRFGQDLMQGGKMMSSPQLVAPGKFQRAGMGRRVVGEVAHNTGHHYAHKSTLGNLVNPLGGAIGGVAGGLTRAGGKELSTAGRSLGGRAGGAIGTVGRGMQRSAGAVGMAGEIAGVAGMGTALGAPISAQGLLGGKALAMGAPGIEHALHGVGHYATHAAHDLAGTAGQGLVGRARQAVGAIRKPALAAAGG